MKYIVEEIPYKYRTAETPKDTYYCHMVGYPHIPVFGSIGDKQKAMSVCKIMNRKGNAR